MRDSRHGAVGEAARRWVSIGAMAQIRSRERVQDLAEVYTHQREVDAMLDLVPDMFPSDEDPGNTDQLFLEPACGHGNFLVEILRRKLSYVTPACYGRGERFEHRILRCLVSTYGIDISEDNVGEARERLRSVIAEHCVRHLGPRGTPPRLDGAVDAILTTNVICADTLTEAAEIELVEYRPGGDGTFVREWSHPLDPAIDEMSLFAPEVVRDEVPVHYSRLALQPEPALVDPLGQEAA